MSDQTFTTYTTPPCEEGRIAAEMAVYRLLEQLEIPYVRVDHPAAMTIEACADVDRALGTSIHKNLFLTNARHTAFYLLVLPGDKVFKTKLLSKQINSSRLSFASAEYMQQFLGLTPGSVSIMGLMNDTGKNVQLLIDRDILKDEYMGCHPCINTSSLKLKLSDVLEKFLPYTGHTPIYVELNEEE